MIDVLTIPDFLDAEVCSRILSEMLAAQGRPAVVYGREAGGAVDNSVRRVERVTVLSATCHFVTDALTAKQSDIGRHFGSELDEPEERQFLRYRPGDFFVAHQDGNTPMIYDDTRFRKVSVVIFLNQQSEEPMDGAYSGGSLVLHGAYPNYDYRQSVPNTPGSLAAFRSETTHEVLPVEAGERFTIVSWYRYGG